MERCYGNLDCWLRDVDCENHNKQIINIKQRPKTQMKQANNFNININPTFLKCLQQYHGQIDRINQRYA